MEKFFLTKGGYKVYHKQSLLVKIREKLIKNCKVYIASSSISDNRQSVSAYICHDLPDFDGSTSPDKLGYKYSWVFSMAPDGNFTDSVQILIYSDIKDDIIELLLYFWIKFLY